MILAQCPDILKCHTYMNWHYGQISLVPLVFFLKGVSIEAYHQKTLKALSHTMHTSMVVRRSMCNTLILLQLYCWTSNMRSDNCIEYSKKMRWNQSFLLSLLASSCVLCNIKTASWGCNSHMCNIAERGLNRYWSRHRTIGLGSEHCPNWPVPEN